MELEVRREYMVCVWGGDTWNWRLGENTWCVCGGGHVELEVRREYMVCVCVGGGGGHVELDVR